MKKELVELMVSILKEYGTISVEDLAEQMDITKRRIHDVLPTLDGLGLIDRSVRGMVIWVEEKEEVVELVETDKVYSSGRLMVSTTKGVITSVSKYGVQSIIVEQTASGFVVNEIEE